MSGLELSDAFEAWSLALEERHLALDQREESLNLLYFAAKRAIRVAIPLILANIGLIVANLVLWR
jgi:hypothetical protein